MSIQAKERGYQQGKNMRLAIDFCATHNVRKQHRNIYGVSP